MKTIILLAVLSVAYGAYIPKKSVRDLGDDVNDFLAFFPLERIQSIFEDYMVNYDETRSIFTYVEMDKFRALIREIDESDHVKKIFKYIESHGYPDVYDTINAVHEFFGWPYVNAQEVIGKQVRNAEDEAAGTWDEMVAKIISYLPLDEIKEFISNKLETSSDFAGLYDLLSNDEAREFAENLYNEQSTKDVIKDLEDKHVNVDQIVQFIKDFLGWN